MGKWSGFAAAAPAAEEHHKRTVEKSFIPLLSFPFCLVHEKLFFLLHVLH
jgi:hypothetical protein